MAIYRRKPVIIEAEQFDPQSNWIDCVVPWAEIKPRDMSWGYVETQGVKFHVLAGDWICRANGFVWVVEERAFPKLYEAVI